MTDYQIAVDYTVAATKTLPALDVHLELTYTDANRSKEDQRLGAYQITNASGTYTTTDSKGVVTTYDIDGIRKRNHAGDNDNKIYPDRTNIVDRYGVTFTFPDPRKGQPNYHRVINLFNNVFKATKNNPSRYEQYSAYHSRNVTLTHGEGTPIATTTASVARVNALAEAADPLCFAQGTRIATARGDVAVEALRVGDLALTACGALRPITWLGRREIDLRRHPRAGEIAPVRVAAHAFGPDMPARDLFLSPGHPVLVGADADNEGGHLVPVMCLVNGTTIRRIAAEAVVYWHVELDGHDILLAEGLPAESYIECGDRTFFTRDDDSVLADPDLVVPGLAGRCRPVAIDGAVVAAERDRLDGVFAARLAHACAWPGVEAARDF